jgi:antitoxin PrlF
MSVLLASITGVRVTQKGQVTIPQPVREALGIRPGSEVRFELDRKGARLVTGVERAEEQIDAMVGAGDGKLSTDEILALTRR